MNTVSREDYVKAVRAHKSESKTVYGENISVMEDYDSNGVYFASAAYTKAVRGEPIIPVYRVRKEYLTGD